MRTRTGRAALCAAGRRAKDPAIGQRSSASAEGYGGQAAPAAESTALCFTLPMIDCERMVRQHLNHAHHAGY